MKTNQSSINKSIKINIINTYRNYSNLKNFLELINKMLYDYDSIISQYEKISSDYIQKLTNLSTKYSEIISQYEKPLKNSDEKFKDLLKLFLRIPAIFNLQITKMQSNQVVLTECCFNSILNNENLKNSNAELEELVNEFETKNKKMEKFFNDLENSSKNLFETYSFIEDSLKKNIIGKEERKFIMNEIFLQNVKNINDKEQMFIKATKDLNKYKKEYFLCYDKYITFSEKKLKETLATIKSNISTFASVLLTYFKTAYNEMEQIIKNMSENEMKVDFSKLKNNIVQNIDQNFKTKKYCIKLINNNYVEDKNKEYDLQKLKKKNYFIEEDKIFLKEEEVYDIIKMMYCQLRFVEEKYYNLSEEQKKLSIKNLTDKILFFSKKDQNLFSLEQITPIKDDEVTHLIGLLNKPIYRFNFLKIFNLFRTQGMCELPEREFEITKNIFIYIADKIKEETDLLSSKLILILAQTFYIKKNEEKIYLVKYLQNHEMFNNLEVWEKNLTETIENDLNRAKVDELYVDEKDPIKISIINNVLTAHILTFCHNMVEFKMKQENFKKIIESMLNKYKLTEDQKKQINELIQNELKGKLVNNA